MAGLPAAELLQRAGFGGMLGRGELRESRTVRTRFGLTFFYRQYYHGLPVVGGGVTLRYNSDGCPRSLFSSLAEWRSDAEPAFRVSSAEVVSIARRAVKPEGLRGGVAAERVVLPRNGRPLFCWKVEIPARRPPGDWEVMVDAGDGSVVQIEDRLWRLDGAGLVFDPDPVSALGDSTLRDRDDAADAVPEGAYSQVELPDIGIEDDSAWVLSGPWVDTSPTAERARLPEPLFLFDRGDDRFEEVMGYFHIDRQARYIRGLGFDDLPPSPQPVNVNGVEEDVSFFSPATGIITFGSGGVDDAEDADVILHEYGHALIHRILPDWRGGESALLSEGLCDYLAGDWSLEAAPDFQPYRLFNWDGNGEFWGGRILNAGYRYPDDAGRQPHDAGQLWSALLTEVRVESGLRDDWNRVVLDHLFWLGDSALVPDAAAALLASDGDISYGRFRRFLIPACEERGIFPYGLHSPAIAHQPLGDIEDFDAPRPISAVITSELPLDTARLWLVHGLNDDPPDTLPLMTGEGDDIYEAVLPAPGGEAEVSYYLFAADSSGVFSTHPRSARLEWHGFHAGPDRIPPQISELDSLYDTVFPGGEMAVGVRVLDNIGVAEVNLLWFYDDMEPGGLGVMQPAVGDSALFIGRMRWSTEVKGSVHYLVTATDASRAGNTSATRRRAFSVEREAVVDDFELPNQRWQLTGWSRSDSAAQQGDWSLADRSPLDEEPLPTAIAELDECWDFSCFELATLSFWELHDFDCENGEFGVLEVREEDLEEWDELLRVADSEPLWQRRDIDLVDYCLGRSGPIRVRFRTAGGDVPRASPSWRIDGVQLAVGNIVGAAWEGGSLPGRLCLSNPYPSPANCGIFFDYSLPRAGAVELLDLRGRLLAALPLPSGPGRSSLGTGSLTSGVYLLRLSDGKGWLARKVVIVR